ncbi:MULTISPECIES: Cro/CI family transcriptional regulator [Alteromonas]|jgi:DNA-binding transcriptional regulator YdaS (Cro superfamily)|uniref:Cro/CI family transcriptional regulator n=1 Tax=Alteromonas TaxID=226 RepID=UPI00258004A1|nr:Cro/CI family transcriptional regulator [Alteromonas sp.]NQY17746.1 helix-turn-helix domain-containing protein [Alteromonas sp.]
MTPEFKMCVEAAGGTQKLLAQKLGITEQAVGKWKDRKIPVMRAIQIESTIGVSRFVIRPDIYTNDQAA